MELQITDIEDLSDHILMAKTKIMQAAGYIPSNNLPARGELLNALEALECALDLLEEGEK